MKIKDSKNQKRENKPIFKVPMYIFVLVLLAVCAIAIPVVAATYQSSGANMGGTVQTVGSAQELVNVLCAPGTSTKNAKITAVSSKQYGIGTNLYVDKSGNKVGVCGNASFDQGLVITTGAVNNAFSYGSSSNGGSASGDSMITSLLANKYSSAYDWTCLEFDVLTGSDGYVGFEYVYLTSEMNYHGTSFVDPFALYVNGAKADEYSNKSAVNVNNQYDQRNNSNDTYYYGNGSNLSGTKYNGISTILGVGKTVSPNTWAHVKVVLADAGDHILDTTVIIRANSLTSDKNYSANKVNISFENNGHGTKPEDILDLTPNTSVTLPTLTDIDYEFKGWYSNKELTTQFTGSNVTSSVTAYAKWVAKKYTVSVNLKRDDSSWGSQTVALYSKGVKEYDLVQAGSVYRCNTVVVNGVSKDFDVYVNGKDSGTDVTVYRNAVSKTIDYDTYVVTTTLDGTAKDVGNISLKNNDPAYSDFSVEGAATFVALPGTYDVNVSGISSGYQVSENNKEISIPYYKATVNLHYAGAEWKNASVTLRQNGKIKYSLPFASNNGDVYEYSVAIKGDTGSDEYEVFVNGNNTGKTLLLNVNSQETVTSIEYYKVTVVAKLDGSSAFTGKGAFLYSDGVSVYQLAESANDPGTYACNYVQKNTSDEYKLMFASEEVGTIKSSSNTTTLNYYTVTYMKNSSEVFKTQTVCSGGKAKSVSGPYISGKTFLAWCSDSELLNTFDFNTAITSNKTVYPKFVVPIVRINSYKRCSASLTDENLSYTNKNTSGTGAYYMPEFTITGFPEGDAKVIKFIEVRITEAKVYVEDVAGVSVDCNNTGNGSGKVKISFGDGLTATEAESYVRSHIVFVPTSTSNGTIKVTVNGTTTD